MNNSSTSDINIESMRAVMAQAKEFSAQIANQPKALYATEAAWMKLKAHLPPRTGVPPDLYGLPVHVLPEIQCELEAGRHALTNKCKVLCAFVKDGNFTVLEINGAMMAAMAQFSGGLYDTGND